MNLRQAFGKAFSQARNSKGLTQEAFEPTARSYISYIERGLSSPTLEKLHDLSKIMGVHPASLVFQAYLVFDKDTSALELMSLIMEDLKKLDKLG